MKTRSKVLSLVLAGTLIVSAGMFGTLAYLTDKTAEVVNTFTTSGIEIELTETTEDYKMVPGFTIEKDPTVTVEADSEDCYLFVKLEKSENFDDFLTYAVSDGWTPLDGVEGVIYRVVANNAGDQTFEVLKDDQVTVKDTVTEEQLTALTNGTYPTLTITAYASQQYKTNDETFTAKEAWNIVSGVSTVQE